jgi:hypothetical protein
MKKKVRYAALGALGVMPALGLAALPATAATQAPAGTGKTVKAVTAQANAPATAPCVRRHASEPGTMRGEIGFSIYNGCIGYAVGVVSGKHLADWMRVRYYYEGTQVSPTLYVGAPSYTGSQTVWSTHGSDPKGIGQVCEAIVSANWNKVEFGPVCENTGYTG